MLHTPHATTQCCELFTVVQVRGLLFKLQAVFDLPKRLHTALEQGAVEIAVNAFADAAPLLKRYGHKVWSALPVYIRMEPPCQHLRTRCYIRHVLAPALLCERKAYKAFHGHAM